MKFTQFPMAPGEWGVFCGNLIIVCPHCQRVSSLEDRRPLDICGCLTFPEMYICQTCQTLFIKKDGEITCYEDREELEYLQSRLETEYLRSELRYHLNEIDAMEALFYKRWKDMGGWWSVKNGDNMFFTGHGRSTPALVKDRTRSAFSW